MYSFGWRALLTLYCMNEIAILAVNTFIMYYMLSAVVPNTVARRPKVAHQVSKSGPRTPKKLRKDFENVVQKL